MMGERNTIQGGELGLEVRELLLVVDNSCSRQV